MKEEILKKLLDYLQNTVVFAQSQIPEVLQQIIDYNKIKLFWFVFIEISTLVVACFIFRYFLKLIKIEDADENGYHKWRTDSQDILMFLSGFMSIFLGISFIVFLLIDVTNLFQIYYAPKVFLIEYIKTIL